ncbi:hypothetical protein Tco_0271771 [Tanacetum coccineum]
MPTITKPDYYSSNIQTELDRTKERFEIGIIKKENEYAKLWNDWYKKCEECKYDKISYDKAYNDMQQKIERLQAQLGDLKGKSTDTPCVSNTLDPLSQKLENANVELEFQDLKTTYKNLFDSISVTRAQTKTIIDSLQHKLHDTIYENAKLRAQLFDKVSDQVDTTKGTSTNTKFANQKVDETNDLSNPVTSNSVPTPQESKNVIAPGMFRINPFKPSREEKYVPNKVRATLGQLQICRVDNTAKTRRPQPRSNTKNNRAPYASKSSCIKNKEVEVEEHHRNLLLSKNKKHMSSECYNVKLAIRNDKSEVVCAIITSLKCVLTQEHLDAICAKYFVPEEVHPQLPSSDATMHERPAGKVGMYTRFFDYANYRIPFSTFFVSVLTHFRIPFSQLSVFGSAKVSHFEIMCRVCNIEPDVSLFRYFYTHNYLASSRQ